MIPKKIHYIWFGGNPLTPLAERCIASWRKFCPDYEIIRWDESNFDDGGNHYFQEAMSAKKWAFASDYVRLCALIKEGGFYLDTDVELVRPLDDSLLDNSAVFGFESVHRISTAFMASEPGNELLAEMKGLYEDARFKKEDGSYDQTTNVSRFTEVMAKNGFSLDGKIQRRQGVLLCPASWFSPKDWYTGKLYLDKDTYAIHHFDGSWATGGTRVKNALLRILGEQRARRIKKAVGR